MVGILQSSQLVSSERRAKEYYKRLRWGKEGRRCLECGGRGLFTLSDGRHECGECHVRFSDFSGTYLSGVKLSFDKIAGLVYLFTLELSARRTARELGVNYKTAYRLFDRIRQAIATNDCKTGLSGEVEL